MLGNLKITFTNKLLYPFFGSVVSKMLQLRGQQDKHLFSYPIPDGRRHVSVQR